MSILKYTLIIIFLLSANVVIAANIPTSARSEKAIASVKPKLEAELTAVRLKYGSPIYIRIFKASSELELWVKSGEKYELFKTYDICTYSGKLGPKTKRGDNQAPEGFYFVKPENLNPWSSYHLSFNLGYPNAYERHHGYTGSALMVHGRCVSIGCYAMTDKYINEIYAMAQGAFEGGQAYFRVHSFPFRMEDENLRKYKAHKWYSFWLNLKEGYDFFVKTKVPPDVSVKSGKYVFNQGS